MKKNFNSNFDYSERKKPTLNQIEKRIFNLFHLKYSISKYFYGKIVAHNIIFNIKTHIVAKFKDYLIIDDLSEFLKRYYTMEESIVRLPGYFEYYHLYSYIFPNYTTLKESKIIYKNIHKKQKIIDLQQEEEYEMKMKELEIMQLKHQRKKNKQGVNIIFDNEVYNSIIKQSNDLNMILFGIEKNKKENKNEELYKSFTSFDIKDIIKSIEKYDDSKIGFNCNKISISKKDKKTNNSSLMTKQSTYNSSIMHQKIKKLKKIYKKNNDNNILIGLKKIKNESKSITSNSFLLSHIFNKNCLLNRRLKSLESGKKFFSNENSKSKSKNKDFKKLNIIKVNQKMLINDKKTYLTDRSSIHKRQKTIQLDFLHNSIFRKDNFFGHKSYNITKNNSKSNTSNINKKSIDFNYYHKIETNSKVQKHKRINTITHITESNFKSYKIKLLNRIKAQTFLDHNNKMKLNLKVIKDLINNNKIKYKYCYTERGSIISTNKKSGKDKIKDKLYQNKLDFGIMKKIFKKKPMISIDLNNKMNKNEILSQKSITNGKINKSNFIHSNAIRELKSNQNLNFKICSDRIINKNIDKNKFKILYTEGSSILVPKNEKRKEKLKNDENMNKLSFLNDYSKLKNIKIKHFYTTTNSLNKDNINLLKSKDKHKYNLKRNFNIKKLNDNNFNFNDKQNKRKEISPIENNLNNTERGAKYLIVKMMSKKSK